MANSPGPSTSSVNGSEKIKIVKKKRIRHKSRSKKKNVVEIVDSIPNFTIEAVKQQNGTVFRHRSTAYNYINLNSFIKVKVPYIFVTELEETFRNFNYLTITNHKHYNRKYEHKVTQHQPVSKRKKRQKDVTFPEYFSKEQVEIGLANGSLVKGFIRINPKNFHEAYVNNQNRTKPDYILTALVDRNRALEGDQVVLELKSSDKPNNNSTNRVVHILKQIHQRTTVGFLRPLENDRRFAELISRDRRFPKLRIPSIFWPNGFENNPKNYENVLFTAKLTKWDNIHYATGTIVENLGLSGDLKVETSAILREHNLDITPHPEIAKKDLPKLTDAVPPNEFNGREDIRKDSVFTIDPATARDLDDAVSCKELDNGNLEIGVHISDVTHYLREDTLLDQVVKNKATTIYLVDNVYHMLPEELCMYCSLLPGVDKLAFSVFWEFTKSGEILNKRLVKTVMNSCVKLAYEHAQLMIDDPDRVFEKDELPTIYNNFTAKDLSRTVNNLQSIAVKLRENRIKSGALRIDQIKLLFSLDPLNGKPLKYFCYENMAAHRLIEEFMLLANITIAEHIIEAFPELAFLRRHESPKQTMLIEFQRILENVGIHIDITSSGGINSSLQKYSDEDFLGKSRMVVLNHLLAKPMIRAEYFCAGCNEFNEDFQHYALSVPIYTHFTSPIRRYADIVVHRLLSASLGYSEKNNWNATVLAEIAENCNTQKYNAKRAGEASCDLYLAHFIKDNQPFIQKAVVVDVRERSLDAIVLNTGSNVRLHFHEFDRTIKWRLEKVQIDPNKVNENEKKSYRVFIDYNATDDEPEVSIVIEMFSIVAVQLSRKEKTNKLQAKLLKPIPHLTFENKVVYSSSSSSSLTV